MPLCPSRNDGDSDNGKNAAAAKSSRPVEVASSALGAAATTAASAAQGRAHHKRSRRQWSTQLYGDRLSALFGTTDGSDGNDMAVAISVLSMLPLADVARLEVAIPAMRHAARSAGADIDSNADISADSGSRPRLLVPLAAFELFR